MPTMPITRKTSAFAAPWQASVTIRRAQPPDMLALHCLAALDEHRDLTGDVLVAEVQGAIWAAAEIDGRGVIADPFRPSGELSLLVAERAALLSSPPARTPLRARLRRRLRAAA
jgi:hypothetical protein